MPPRSSTKSQSPASGWSATRGRELRALFATVPYPNLLGMKLKRLADGEAEILLPAADSQRQYQGIIHGGALASVADTAATFAAMTMLPEGTDVVTIEFKMNFLKALESGRAIAYGRIVRMGSRVTVADVSIHGTPDRTLLATGTFTMLNFTKPAQTTSRKRSR